LLQHVVNCEIRVDCLEPVITHDDDVGILEFEEFPDPLVEYLPGLVHRLLLPEEVLECVRVETRYVKEIEIALGELVVGDLKSEVDKAMNRVDFLTPFVLRGDEWFRMNLVIVPPFEFLL
jgi:hypothetical protein